jgi:peroxidase
MAGFCTLPFCFLQAGGATWSVPAGRYDGFVSIAAEAVAALPDPTFTVEQLTNSFSAVGLSQLDMLTLSGLVAFPQNAS